MRSQPSSTSCPPGVARTRDGFAVTLSLTPPRPPSRSDYIVGVTYSVVIVSALMATLLPTLVGMPQMSQSSTTLYYLVMVALLSAGAGGAYLLVRLLLDLVGGAQHTRIDVRGDGFLLSRRDQPRLHIAWCALHDATIPLDQPGRMSLRVGWPGPDELMLMHTLDVPLEIEADTARWLIETLLAWKENTPRAVPSKVELPAWVYRSERPPDGLGIQRSGERMQVDVGQTLRGLQHRSTRIALASLVAAPLAAPAVGLPIWLAMPASDQHQLIPTIGVSLVVAGFVLVMGCVAVALLALRSVRSQLTLEEQHLTIPATAESDKVQVPWASVLGADVGVIGEGDTARGVLRVRLDPVTAPIIPRRDEQGRGVVAVGRGMPVDQLAWISEEVERRRRRATQTPAPPRRSGGLRYGAPGPTIEKD